MYKKKNFVALVISTLLASSVYAENCTFELDKNSVSVEWTAFKTTQKTPVKGSFKKIEVQGKTTAKDVPDLLTGLSLTVDKTSVDTGNPARDKTLGEFFFAKLAPKISGKVKDVTEKTHSFNLDLNFNNESKNVVMRYENVGDDKFIATGDMDITNFGGAKALESLNAKCLDLHKGADGVSKTWADVTISVSGAIKKNCH